MSNLRADVIRIPPGKAGPAARSESCVVVGRPILRSVDSEVTGVPRRPTPALAHQLASARESLPTDDMTCTVTIRRWTTMRYTSTTTIISRDLTSRVTKSRSRESAALAVQLLCLDLLVDLGGFRLGRTGNGLGLDRKHGISPSSKNRNWN